MKIIEKIDINNLDSFCNIQFISNSEPLPSCLRDRVVGLDSIFQSFIDCYQNQAKLKFILCGLNERSVLLWVLQQYAFLASIYTQQF